MGCYINYENTKEVENKSVNEVKKNIDESKDFLSYEYKASINQTIL